ncbi:MAG TPA: extracellular solute-binding protein [Bifidobacteriaceae bacterium]|nr:extracellular solute-binding protein [Bifidobacteriaceae bacterium]
MVEKGYFGTTYDSVKHTDGAAPALLEQGKAGFELMGSFGYSGHKAAAPEFTNDDLGYMVFPPIDGVKGDAKDLVGNPCNYFSMNKYTKHPEACVEFLKMLYSDKCVEDQLKAGNLPATTNASEMVEKVVDNASDGAFLEWESQALTDAPHFMITWTPNHVSSSSQPMLDGMQQYFNGSIDMGTFIDEMKALPTE